MARPPNAGRTSATPSAPSSISWSSPWPAGPEWRAPSPTPPPSEQGWAFGQLRRALEEARLTRTPPWGPLGRLGQALGVDELSELAASVALAGAEGARVRASLAAKATSIRSHALADAQADAEAMSERMSLPVVVLFAGFLLFVGYPALAHVLAGLR